LTVTTTLTSPFGAFNGTLPDVRASLATVICHSPALVWKDIPLPSMYGPPQSVVGYSPATATPSAVSEILAVPAGERFIWACNAGNEPSAMTSKPAAQAIADNHGGRQPV
jgi:hypothetical protein